MLKAIISDRIQNSINFVFENRWTQSVVGKGGRAALVSNFFHLLSALLLDSTNQNLAAYHNKVVEGSVVSFFGPITCDYSDGDQWPETSNFKAGTPDEFWSAIFLVEIFVKLK